MTDSSGDPEEIASSIIVLQYSCLAAIVLYFYDFLLTFSQEVTVIWGRKMSKNMALLLLNRYLTLFAYIPTSTLLFDQPGQFGIELVSLQYVYIEDFINNAPKGCPSFIYFPGVLSATGQAIVVYFSAVRTLAIYERSFRVTCVVVPLAVATVAVSAWSLTQLDSSFSVGEGLEAIHACFPLLQSSDPFIVSWSCNMVYDILIFGLVVTKTYRMRMAFRRLDVHGGSRLVNKLMRHGAF
ncbi:hypothetical protein SCHPADRAFT_945724 [Schizopora paradoxa]|uniref:DUF6533 domain-containing protein n=1 Tax=Schizopora paradoxa TaxID=27342 RepID=A0A0H2R6G2_9AGAM|nr:hypothetical protein SCHPADRAFT_945724 [Schizopora paradoxa]